MRLPPQRRGGEQGINTDLAPPNPFGAMAMQLAMMRSAERRRKLDLRPRARPSANLTWWASEGLRPQTRQGWALTNFRWSRSRIRSDFPIGVTGLPATPSAAPFLPVAVRAPERAV